MSACLPKRWAHLQPYGAQVEGTAFVPCKVPLDKRFDRSYAKPADRFELIEFLDRLENELGKKILAVVDLTQTDRYYEKNHLLARGIQHVKFWGVKGHDTIPAEGFVTQFIRVTSEIEKQNPDGVIVVHCTHGLNRTGYVICRYLQDVSRLTAEEAIARFAKARHGGIQKSLFIDMLHWLTVKPSEDDIEDGRFPDPSAVVYPDAEEEDVTRGAALCIDQRAADKQVVRGRIRLFKAALAETSGCFPTISDPRLHEPSEDRPPEPHCKRKNTTSSRWPRPRKRRRGPKGE